MTTPEPIRRRRLARRGSIYAVVLGMAILVSLIGLSAVALGRANLRTAAVSGDGTEAELLALSAVEHAAATINANPTWRTDYKKPTDLSPALALGRGTFTWRLIDEIDGDTSVGGPQPVRILGTGIVGDARRCYSVRLQPGGTNLFSNPGTEQGLTGYEVQGGDCLLEPAADAPHDGARYIWVKARQNKAAGPQQNILGKVVGGKSYYAELWMRTTTVPEYPMLSIVVKQPSAGDVIYKVRANQQAGTEWTRVGGAIPLVPAWSGSPTAVYFRVETDTTSQEFKIDDLRIVEGTTATPMVPAAETWKQESLP